MAWETLLAQIADIFCSSVALYVQTLHCVVALGLLPARRTRLAQAWNSPAWMRPVSSITFNFISYQSYIIRKWELGTCICSCGKPPTNTFVVFEYLSHWMIKGNLECVYLSVAVWVDNRMSPEIVSSHSSDVAPYYAVRWVGFYATWVEQDVWHPKPTLRVCKWMTYIWGDALFEYFCSET